MTLPVIDNLRYTDDLKTRIVEYALNAANLPINKNIDETMRNASNGFEAQQALVSYMFRILIAVQDLMYTDVDKAFFRRNLKGYEVALKSEGLELTLARTESGIGHTYVTLNSMKYATKCTNHNSLGTETCTSPTFMLNLIRQRIPYRLRYADCFNALVRDIQSKENRTVKYTLEIPDVQEIKPLLESTKTLLKDLDVPDNHTIFVLPDIAKPNVQEYTNVPILDTTLSTTTATLQNSKIVVGVVWLITQTLLANLAINASDFDPVKFILGSLLQTPNSIIPADNKEKIVLLASQLVELLRALEKSKREYLLDANKFYEEVGKQANTYYTVLDRYSTIGELLYVVPELKDILPEEVVKKARRSALTLPATSLEKEKKMDIVVEMRQTLLKNKEDIFDLC